MIIKYHQSGIRYIYVCTYHHVTFFYLQGIVSRMTFFHGIRTETQYAHTASYGGTLIDGTDPALQILVRSSIQIVLFDQSFRPLVVHHVGDRVLVSAQVCLLIQCPVEDIQNSFRFDRVPINGILPIYPQNQQQKKSVRVAPIENNN